MVGSLCVCVCRRPGGDSVRRDNKALMNVTSGCEGRPRDMVFGYLYLMDDKPIMVSIVRSEGK